MPSCAAQKRCSCRAQIDATRHAVFAEDNAQIADIEFAPGKIQFRALARGSAGRLFLNKRSVEGWHSDLGDFTIDPQTGLAYIDAAARRHGQVRLLVYPTKACYRTDSSGSRDSLDRSNLAADARTTAGA